MSLLDRDHYRDNALDRIDELLRRVEELERRRFPTLVAGDEDGGDYCEVEADGTVVFSGEATVWNDENLGSASLGAGATAPDLVQIGATGIFVRAFDGNATTEQLFGEIEVPHSYREGSDLHFHVHWMPADGNAGNVRWQLAYIILRDGDTAGAATTISVTTAATGTQYKSARSDFPAIAGAFKIGDQFLFRFFRNPGDGADTYGSDALAMTLGFHFEQDTVGSRLIGTK